MGNQKYILLAFLVAAVLLGFSVQGLSQPLLVMLELGDPRIFGVVNASSFGGVLVAGATFLVLNRHAQVYRFTDECVSELRKVTWPTKADTVRSTLVVLGCTAVIALSLAIYDFAWARITNVFLFTES